MHRTGNLHKLNSQARHREHRAQGTGHRVKAPAHEQEPTLLVLAQTTLNQSITEIRKYDPSNNRIEVLKP